jgi:hypothetical protein
VPAIAVQTAKAFPMKLFVQSTIVFFGTLLAAALVALGQPASAEVQMAQPDTMLVSLLGLAE